MDIEQARFNMVQQQVRPWDVLEPAVLEALAACPRESFVPEAYQQLAFSDTDIPLANGQTMLPPKVVGRLLQALELTGTETVLEIGTGSGYITYLLAKLAHKVTSYEIHESLYQTARKRLQTLSVPNATIVHEDAFAQLSPSVKYDCVVLTGAVYSLPSKVQHCLKPHGRIFAFAGAGHPIQALLINFDAAAKPQLPVALFETKVPYLENISQPETFRF